MQFEWNETKAAGNVVKHGLSFDLAARFEIVTALVVKDDRRDYGEKRLVGLGLIGPLVAVLVFTERKGKVRVISLRPANRKEIRDYVEGSF